MRMRKKKNCDARMERCSDIWIKEPEKYKVLRGSRDGFVETLVYNTALIRRRIRSPEYRCEITQIGECSRTDVAICYIEGRVDKEAL